MERFLVTGGARLTGTVEVAGAKNSVLKLMAAALLAEGTTTISNCPEILDVPLMADVLRGLGAEVAIDGDMVWITTPAEGHAYYLKEYKDWGEYVRIAQIEPQG